MNKHTGFSNISCIYKIISPTGRIYVGKSKRLTERMSASRKGKSSWNKGIQHSDGAKQKMSTAKLGRKLSEEHIQNLAKAHFKKVDIYDNKNVLIKTCCSVIETATFIEGHTCYVSLCLKGKKKNYKKYTFAYHE